jgi:hypothetical protein
MTIVDKSLEEILKHMENRAGDTIETLAATIQAKLVGKLCNTIDTASENLLRQISLLKELIEKARDDFVTESGAFRKSMGEIQTSLEEFQKSNETASKALTRATYVLAFVALVQAVILAYPLFK